MRTDSVPTGTEFDPNGTDSSPVGPIFPGGAGATDEFGSTP
jgi:hypothetical protein